VTIPLVQAAVQVDAGVPQPLRLCLGGSDEVANYSVPFRYTAGIPAPLSVTGTAQGAGAALVDCSLDNGVSSLGERAHAACSSGS
jgi:hypothetical protein